MLLNSHASWDAFIENILLELLEGVFFGLRFQPLVFVESETAGERCVDTMGGVNFAVDLIGHEVSGFQLDGVACCEDDLLRVVLAVS